MWGTLFLIGGWLTVTPVSDMTFVVDTIWQDNENTSTFLVEFSEPMDTLELRNINNYSVTNEETGVPLVIQKIGIVVELNDAPPSPPIDVTGNKLVAVITNRAEYKKTYMIVVTGVRDLAGNYIQDNNSDSYYFVGIRPSFIKPNVNISK